MISYEKLWIYMKEHSVSQYFLMQHGIGNKTLYNIKHGAHISTSTLEKLCVILECTPNDIIDFRPDPPSEP